jgi:HK97 family phage portal protein
VTFVVSSGQLASLNRPSYNYVQGPVANSIRLGESFQPTYAQIWETQPQVRTVIDFLARNIAQLKLRTYRRVSETDRERLRDHPFAQLVRKPNPYTTRYRFFDAIVHDRCIFDAAYLAKVRVPGPNGGPQHLMRLDPARVQPLGEENLWPTGFRYGGERNYRDFRADEVVYLRGYNPSDARIGLSPLATLRSILVEEYEAGVWRAQMWRNGARFPGYIARPAEAPEWPTPARERFKASFQASYSGNGSNAGGTPILEEGMTFHPSGITPEQAQYLQTRKLTREEVASAFHIPLPMVGILDHATFSNIEEQHRNLYQDTLGPWLTEIEEEFMLQLLPELDSDPDVYCEFDLQDKLKGDFDQETRALVSATGGPFMSRNEARARRNLPQIDGGDELIVPLNVTEGGQGSPFDSAPDDNTPKQIDAGRVEKFAQDFTTRQARVLQTGRDLDPQRWSRELTRHVLELMED